MVAVGGRGTLIGPIVGAILVGAAKTYISDQLKVTWNNNTITLWPIDIEGLLRAALDRVASGRHFDKRMILLIDLLPSPPSNEIQWAVSEHEHSVQHGNYEPLIRARHKYQQIESQLARDRAFQTQWNSIKAHFDVAKFADHKGILRRRLVAERSMREHWPFRAARAFPGGECIAECFAHAAGLQHAAGKCAGTGGALAAFDL